MIFIGILNICAVKSAMLSGAEAPRKETPWLSRAGKHSAFVPLISLSMILIRFLQLL
jgi:hypothetical protein